MIDSANQSVNRTPAPFRFATENYPEEEARKGRREDFEKVMKAVPGTEPEEYDRI